MGLQRHDTSQKVKHIAPNDVNMHFQHGTMAIGPPTRRKGEGMGIGGMLPNDA